MWITDGDFSGPTTSILIDIGPDFRSQALKSSINRLDALLVTHGHADHLNGLDDIRIFSHTGSQAPSDHNGVARVYPETAGEGLPLYGNSITLQDVRQRFSYVFQPMMEGGGKPKLKTIDCSGFSEENPIVIGDISIIPIPMLHGRLETTGWLLLKGYKGNGEGPCRGIAYLTDCNKLPQKSLELLRGFGPVIQHLVIDGLRQRPHSTHFSYDQALDVALEIGAGQSWLTHLCHDMNHQQIQDYLADRISQLGRNFQCQPAYDGLVLEV
jgi:phosphoribosyl 1,2-cyclic phosphate phosphodiesterase